jgi:hypothetical protein
MPKQKAAHVVIAPEIIEANRVKISEADLAALVERLDEVDAHIKTAAAAARLAEQPFPHALIAPVLPAWLYELIRKAWPSPEFFGQPKPSRQILDLGVGHGSFGLLPDTLQRFWTTVQSQVLQRMLGGAMVDLYSRYFDRKFEPILSGYTPGDWQALGLEFERAGLMVHSPGFELKPHVDSPRYAVVYLLYCPADDEHLDEGTDLYAMTGDLPVRQSLRTLYPDVPPGTAPVVSLPYRRNSLATFLVADRSLHGVTIKQLDERRVINCAVKVPDSVLERFTVAS